MTESKHTKQRNDIALIIGLCLICFGGWKLAERLFGSWWPSITELFGIIASFVWPIALIVAGVFVIYAVRKGTIEDASGKRLVRTRSDRKIAGVCGGLAAFFNIDAVLVRLVALVLLILSFFSVLILYVILWIILPEEPISSGQWV